MLSNSGQSGSPLWVVAVALVNEAGETLVQQRSSAGAHANLWEFPGGKIDPGETPHAAAAREISEELGVTVAIEDLCPVSFASGPSESPAKGHSSVVILLFSANQWVGTPEALVASRLAWCDPHELATWAMPPLDYPLAVALTRMHRK